jgi:hypothetical protein
MVVFQQPAKKEEILKGIPNMGNIMKQAQQFQAKLAKMQEELGDKTVEASSGGGMITATANGRQEIVAIKIEPEVVNASDVEMLQDLVLAAVNDALAKAKAMMNEEMANLTKGLGIPNIPGLF